MPITPLFTHSNKGWKFHLVSTTIEYEFQRAMSQETELSSLKERENLTESTCKSDESLHYCHRKQAEALRTIESGALSHQLIVDVCSSPSIGGGRGAAGHATKEWRTIRPGGDWVRKQWKALCIASDVLSDTSHTMKIVGIYLHSLSRVWLSWSISKAKAKTPEIDFCFLVLFSCKHFGILNLLLRKLHRNCSQKCWCTTNQVFFCILKIKILRTEYLYFIFLSDHHK